MSQLSQHETTAPKSASSKKAKRPRDEFETGSATKLESAGRKKKKKTTPDSASPDSEEQASQSPTSSRRKKHSISGLQAGTVVVDPRTASGEKHVQSIKDLAGQYPVMDDSESRSPSPSNAADENDNTDESSSSMNPVEQNIPSPEVIRKMNAASHGSNMNAGDTTFEQSQLEVRTPAPNRSQSTSKTANQADKAKSNPTKKVSSIIPWPKKYTANSMNRWDCPVVGCNYDGSRRDTIGRHINQKHVGSGKTLVDNGDATLSIHDTGDGTDSSDEDDAGIPSRIADSSSKTQTQSSRPHESPVPRPSVSAKPSTVARKSDKSSTLSTSTSIDDVVAQTVGPIWNAVNDLGKRVLEQASHSASDESADTSNVAAKPTKRKDAAATKPGFSKFKLTKDGATSKGSQLEDWELKAEKVVVDGHSIAYSGPYLTSRPLGIQILGATYKVHHLLPAEAVTMTANSNLVRQCPVTQGQVYVDMGQSEFSVSQHGVFVVRPGTKCTVTNRGFASATFLSMASIVDNKILNLCD